MFVSSWRLKSPISTLLMGYVNIHDWIRLCVNLTKWAINQGITADTCHSPGGFSIAQHAVLWVRNTLCVDQMLKMIVIALPSIPDMVLTCQMLVFELCSTLSAKGATKGSI